MFAITQVPKQLYNRLKQIYWTNFYFTEEIHFQEILMYFGFGKCCIILEFFYNGQQDAHFLKQMKNMFFIR